MTPAEEIAAAARAWLDGLDEPQRARATFPFADAERYVWAYTPGTREGLPITEMGPEQRAASNQILASALSARTVAEVTAVMALETVLGGLERADGRPGWDRRDPGLYWFAVFGSPGSTSPWSWRVGGHHVAMHVTVLHGRVIGTTPSFLGANPAVVPSGAGAGGRTLTGEESLARALLSELTAAERGAAIINDVAPTDILSGTSRNPDVRSVPAGVRHADLGPPRRAAMERLIRHYLDRARPEVADETWARILAAGLGDASFAWAGSDALGRGHYYAVRGPTFLIEYDNTQNGANHIHSVWRELANDWGADLLAAHLADVHAADAAGG
jgi:hypothetical protein